MEIEIRTTHLSRNSWAQERAADFVKKISHFEKIKFQIIKDEKNFLKGVSPKDRVVVCDERGENLSSRKFASIVENYRNGGIQKLYFFIGGPFGSPEELLQRSDLKFSLSSLVMNQEVALAVLFEQIFRAYTIINNHPYHND